MMVRIRNVAPTEQDPTPMKRHRLLDRSRRAPRPLRFDRLESRLLLTGIPTVGVYDENVVDPNTVDFVATGSSVTNTQFAAQVVTAFSQDSGGGDGWGGPWTALQLRHRPQSKVLTVLPATGNNWGIGTAYHISKMLAFATGSPYDTLTLNFTSIANGAANEHVVSIGVTRALDHEPRLRQRDGHGSSHQRRLRVGHPPYRRPDHDG